MSLRVWLPLNGDLHNQGLSNISVTNNGAAVDNNGKIGKCYSFDGNSYLQASSLSGVQSICFWVKLEKKNSLQVVFVDYKSKLAFGFNDSNQIIVSCVNKSINMYSDTNFPNNIWTHIALVYTSDNSDILLYINGMLQTSRSTKNNWIHTTDNLIIGARNNGSIASYMAGYINDFRIYDHVLSELEVKEIARGLVLHYPLCENLGSGLNLIKNGFGELGTDNWTSKTMFSNDVPEDQPEIKQSVYGNSTIEYIPFWHNCTYRVSLWVKSTATSGYSYPSFIPYDIDKNQIQVRHTKYGFNMSTMTTLAQPLNPGDTKIYVTDLSKWNTASSHYYNYAAIFGYADSTGYIYPDGIYTRNIPAFGSGTSEKTNLDKTNNIINLINTYNGPAIPAGRSICASCDGSTYFYPFGGIANTSIQDWTYKTTTFTSNNSYLVAARFLRFINIYNTTYCAGIKLVNESTIKTNNIMYDISGYCNNGTIVNSLTTVMPSPKFNCATHFNGSAYIYTTSPCAEVKTLSLWVKWDTIPSGQSVVFLDAKSHIGLGLMSNGILCITSGLGSGNTFSKTNLVANTWYHFVVVNPGGTTDIPRKLYINGIEQIAISTKSNWTYSIDQTQIGKRSTTSDGFVGSLSDVRMYATALGAGDVLDLYNNSVLVDE